MVRPLDGEFNSVSILLYEKGLVLKRTSPCIKTMELEKKTNFKICATLQSLIASTLNQSLNNMTREKERKRPIDWTFEPYPPEQTELIKIS